MTQVKHKTIATLKTHDELVADWLQDAHFKAEYDALEEEYQLLREMLSARKRAQLTQAEVAEKMGTKAPSVVRLEASSGQKKHSPSLNTLRKYAQAVGCRLEIHLTPLAQRSNTAKSKTAKHPLNLE